jgi:phosphopantetheinyl transferase
MPLVYQQNINAHTRSGVWHITETEDFFLAEVPLQQNIAHPHKRLQHLAGRYLLKVLFPQFPLALIRIADTRKPYLQDDPFHFSISHCGDYAAVIVSEQYRVGIDIEKVTEKIGRVMHKFLSAPEQQLVPGGVSLKTATLLWSAKEAAFKWYGKGQVDFREHMPLQYIDKGAGELQLLFLKEMPVLLPVHFIIMDDHWLSWVLTEK